MSCDADLIKECPSCHRYLRGSTLPMRTSSEEWTDGHSIHLERCEPLYSHCPWCKAFIRSIDTKMLGTCRTKMESAEWESKHGKALPLQHLTIFNVFNGIDFFSDSRDAIRIRILAWQTYNHYFRSPSPRVMQISSPLDFIFRFIRTMLAAAVRLLFSGKHHTNMERIISDIGADEEGLLIKGELFRELGRFDESAEQLRRIPESSYYHWKANAIQSLVESKSRDIITITKDSV